MTVLAYLELSTAFPAVSLTLGPSGRSSMESSVTAIGLGVLFLGFLLLFGYLLSTAREQAITIEVSDSGIEFGYRDGSLEKFDWVSSGAALHIRTYPLPGADTNGPRKGILCTGRYRTLLSQPAFEAIVQAAESAGMQVRRWNTRLILPQTHVSISTAQ
jgi:hypothetical protein